MKELRKKGIAELRYMTGRRRQKERKTEKMESRPKNENIQTCYRAELKRDQIRQKCNKVKKGKETKNMKISRENKETYPKVEVKIL